MFQIKVVYKNTFCVQQFFPKIVPFMIMWKNIVRPDRLQMTDEYALHAGYVKAKDTV